MMIISPQAGLQPGERNQRKISPDKRKMFNITPLLRLRQLTVNGRLKRLLAFEDLFI
ncbi:hypothetical protein [uncultured Chitinophaga sp.]|uniref:hypothetical protein n=1 Tax=uncultured Chitinophaga sp. TaxID=339340 RepID=UPI0025D8F0E3|nr:hypothetical protein [uncultured Chitinophaga sp.]